MNAICFAEQLEAIAAIPRDWRLPILVLQVRRVSAVSLAFYFSLP
jgi:hypothetical protein